MTTPGADALLDHVSAVLPVEQAVIGAVLYGDPVRVPPLLASEFCLEKHRRIWQAILDLHGAGDPLDVVTVAHRLAATDALEGVGGSAALALLAAPLLGAIPVHLPVYARAVRDAARRRQLHDLGLELARAGLDEAEVTAKLRQVPGPLAPNLFDPAVVWADIVEAAKMRRLRTGLAALDAVALGLQPGDLLVIGARTSMGKTAMAVQLALHFAGEGVPVDFYALEESSQQVLRRMLANRTGIKTRVIRDGLYSPAEFEACQDAVRAIQDLPLSVSDISYLRSLDEERLVEVAGASEGQVLIVDHLQKVATRGEARNYGLERVMNGLHAVALRDRKIVILTAQLNREAEHRKGPPTLGDLRDSGGIEIIARMIWLLSWPHTYDPARSWQEYEVKVAKQGEAGTGTVQLSFDPACGRFS